MANALKNVVGIPHLPRAVRRGLAHHLGARDGRQEDVWFGVEAPPPSVDIVSAQLVSAGQVLASGWGETTGYWEVTAPTLGWVGLDAAGSVVRTMIYDHHPGSSWPPPPCAPWSQPGLSYPGDYLDNWIDWGWRHIQAKHGWNQDDELATRSALQAPAFTRDEGNGVMRYIGPEYSARGARCERHVVVDYTIEAVSGEPSGIRTSFGRYLREAP